MKTLIKKIFLVLLMISLMSVAVAPTTWAKENEDEEEQRVVKVAYPEQTNLTEIDENGNYYGYSYDYLKKIAEFANWKLEYVTYPNLTLDEQISSAMTMVESGEADLLGVMLKNEDLEEKYLYPKNNYGVVWTTLEALDTNIAINDVSIMNLDVLKIAVLKKATTRNAELTSFLESSNINYEYIYCDSVAEQIEILKEGKADTLLKVSLTFLPDLKQVAKFSPRPYYFVTNFKNEELKNEMDEAIQKINLSDPYFESRLQAKYFQNMDVDFSLSDAEMEYVSNNNTAEVLVLPGYAPLAFMNKNNELCGMSISILKELAKKANLNINFHVLKEDENLNTLISSNKFDIVLGPSQSYHFAQQYGLILSQSYLDTDLEMFINKSVTSKPKSECTLALLHTVNEVIEYDYKDIKYYDTAEECLEAVDRGEADYGYINQYIVDFYKAQTNYKNINYLNLTGYTREVGFYVPNDRPIELLSIINRYIRSTINKDVHSYLALALSQKDNSGIDALIQNDPLLVVIIAVSFLFLVLILIFLALYNLSNKKRNRQLQQALNAKSDFLSRMSHDMRTPMNGIIGLTGLTLDTNQLPEEVQDNLEKIDESAKFLLSLINDTLDMNKIESNKIVLNKEVTDLNEFFLQMISVIKVNAQLKKVNLICRQNEDKMPLAYLDKIRVQQIVFNLVSNAIKFTPENGTVEIIGECHVVENKHIFTRLTVKDNGIGISKEFLPKIFEPFEQEYNSSTSDYGGTGLGLAIVKNLVEIMNGKIFVKSKRNEGTEISVSIPFEFAKEHERLEHSNKQSTATYPLTNLNGKVVLVCEDHPLNAKIAQKLLEKYGVEVVVAKDGKVGVELFTTSEINHFDAILMDIRMPVMDGLMAAKAIRQLDRKDAKVIPIIAMTANAYEEDREKSKQAGMNAHIAKPINAQLLYETLSNLIGKREE